MKMQGLADQERGFGDGIGGAVRKGKLRFLEAADGIADEIEQGQQFAAWQFRHFCRRPFYRLDGPGHQDFVQRAAAASSWARASTQSLPFALSSCFQNGAEVFR